MKLIPQKKLTPVLRVLGSAKAYLRSVAISGHRVFGARTYIIPRTRLMEVDARLVELAADVLVAADRLADEYEALVEEQRARLGPLFRRALYLAPAEVRARFGLEWDYVSFAAPDRLETIDHGIYERTVARHEARLADAYDEVVRELRGDALETVRALEERLGVDEAGQPRVLRGTALRALQDYLANLPGRNLADDEQLAAVMRRVEARVAGVEVADLRSDADLRMAVRQAATEAREALVALVEEAPRRRLLFGGGQVA